MTNTIAHARLDSPVVDGSAQDMRDIKATVLDYCEGWFDADPDRMRRALHPSLAKRSRAQDEARTPAVSSVTAEQMITWTAAGEGRPDGVPDRSVEIDVADVGGDIASVIAHSHVYVDHLHLVRTPDGWRIINALWRYADGHGPAT